MGDSEILLERLRREIEALKPSPTRENFGKVLSFSDGVARASGLSEVMLNERVEFADGSIGLAFNLEEEEVGIIVLSNGAKINEGDEVRATGTLLTVPVGKNLLGRVVNGLGEAIDGGPQIRSDVSYPVDRMAPGIRMRQPVNQPLQTGILAIDSMIPIGRGQRELIIGDRSTGKGGIVLDTIINQSRLNRQGLASGDPNFRPVYSIYVSIGQKRSTLARTIQTLEENGALQDTIVVTETASDSPTGQYIAPYAGTAMGEWFMENDMDALIVYDDLSKHAVAYRQISLILKRPAGRQAYPGDIFFLHSRLLERSARLTSDFGNGSLTALPIVETQEGDVSAYIPTNIISITDGQIYLDTDLFNRGIRPAIATGISVSRVGSAAQIKAFKQIAGKIKLELGQYYELTAFAQFGSDLDARTRAQLDRGARIVELFKQPQFAPKSVAIQILLLWAVQNGIFDPIPLEQVGDAVLNLEQWISSVHGRLLDDLMRKGEMTAELEGQMREAVAGWDFAKQWETAGGVEEK